MVRTSSWDERRQSSFRTPPRHPSRGGTAWFRGVQLLDRPYAEVVAELEAQGVRVEPAELGGRVPDHGFALHLRGLQNPSMPISAVAFTGPITTERGS